MTFTSAEHWWVMFFRRYDAQFTRAWGKLWRQIPLAGDKSPVEKFVLRQAPGRRRSGSTPVTNSSLAVSLRISCSCIPFICVITDSVYVEEKVRPPVFSADKCRDHSLVYDCGSKFSENPGGEQWVSLSHMVETSALFTGKLPLLLVWITAAEVTEGDGAAWGLEHPSGLWENRSEVWRWEPVLLLSVSCVPSTSLSESARLRQALQSAQPTRVSLGGEVL